VQISLFPEPGWNIGDVERWCADTGVRWIVGLDEAGRGPLAGPVYAAAVLLDTSDLEHEWIRDLNDSKKLSEVERERLYDAIRESGVEYHIASRDHADVDEYNILRASLSAMEDALGGISQTIDLVAVDGNQRIETTLRQRTLVKGDGRSLAIAAASILAKVSRDREMVLHDQHWPEYGFAKNKGYGSPSHLLAISEYGPCEIHRLTFGGVKEHANRLRS